MDAAVSSKTTGSQNKLPQFMATHYLPILPCCLSRQHEFGAETPS
jgi:hypothetical protein